MAAPTFELERFECVDAGRGTVLLRVCGRWRGQRAERLADTRLVIDDGRSRRSVAALPGPAESASARDGAPWRVAFPVAAELLDARGITYALESSSGAIVELPRPSAASPRAPRAADGAVAAPRQAAGRDDVQRLRAEGERAARERREAMRVLEQRLDAERVARAAAECEALEAREALAQLRAEAHAARGQGDERARALGERIARLERERGEADVALRQERAQIAAARAALEARLTAERLTRGRLQELDAARLRAEARAEEQAKARREAQLAATASEEARRVVAARAAAAEKVVKTARLVERERDRAVIAARAAEEARAEAVGRMRLLERRIDEERSRAETAERAQHRVPELQARLSELERVQMQLAARADRVPALERALEELGAQARAEIEQATAGERAARADAADVIARLREEVGEARAALAQGEEEARALVARVAALESERAGAEETVRASRADLAAARVKLAAVRAELTAARAEAERGGAAERAVRAELASVAARIGELEQVLRARERTLDDVTAARTEAEATIARASQQTPRVERERDEALAAARQAANRTENAHARIRRLEGDLARARAQARSTPPRPVERSRPVTLPQQAPAAPRRAKTLPALSRKLAHALAERVRALGSERPEPAGDRRARVFVWTCWALLLVTSAYFVLKAGRNIPIQEDWHVVAAATGNQDGFWGWVWDPNNEHRVPIAKLVYVALFQLWPDFRVGMIFNLAALAGIAAAFVVFMRRLRGRTRWTDAFFPLIFLHLGNWENFGWSWQLTFVIAAAVGAAMLMLITARGGWTTRRASLLVACLVVTPFTGATVLPFAAAVAVVLLLERRNACGRPRTILTAGGLLTLLLSALYFVDLPKSDWVPDDPGFAADLWTGGKFLALGLGPAAGGWWLLSVAAVIAAIGSATWLLWRARRNSVWLLLAFVAAGVALAATLGRGRSGAVDFYGLPDRYVLVAAPLICAVYLTWERFGGPRLRRFGPAALCAGMLLLLPLNTVYGAQWKDWYQARVDTFAADIEAGVPLAQLVRYRPLARYAWEMRAGMLYMRAHKIGVFEDVRLVPPKVRGWAIDGFRSGAGGWETLKGPVGRARLVRRDGKPEMRWEYNATRKFPAVLGRSFPTPADWTGAGALAFTVTGQASQRRIRVRLLVDDPDGGVARFETWFIDVTKDPMTLAVPWNGFGRVNARGVYVDVLKSPLPLTGVRSVTFITGDTGPGVLRIQRLALTPGHAQLGWPLHSAVKRSSLPPLQ